MSSPRVAAYRNPGLCYVAPFGHFIKTLLIFGYSLVYLWVMTRIQLWNEPKGDLWNEPNEFKRANFVTTQRAMSLVFGNDPQERFRSVEALCGIVVYSTHQDFTHQMSKYEKTLQYILGARMDTSIRFSDVVSLLKRLGFNLRIRGDHHILVVKALKRLSTFSPKALWQKHIKSNKFVRFYCDTKLG